MHIFGFSGNFIINMSYISRIAASFSRQLDQAVGAGPLAIVPGRHLCQPLANNDNNIKSVQKKIPPPAGMVEAQIELTIPARQREEAEEVLSGFPLWNRTQFFTR